MLFFMSEGKYYCLRLYARHSSRPLLFSVALEDLFKVSVELELPLLEDGVVHRAEIAAKLGSDVSLDKVLGVELAVALVRLLVHDGAVVDRVAEERLSHAVEVVENPRSADDVMLMEEHWNSTLEREVSLIIVSSIYVLSGMLSLNIFVNTCRPKKSVIKITQAVNLVFKGELR